MLPVIALLFVCLTGLVGYKLYFAAPPSIPIKAVALSSTVKQPLQINWPTQGESAVSAVGSSVVLTSNKDATPAPTASVAKLMTTLAILKKHPLKPGQAGPKITITEQDVLMYNDYVQKDGSVVPVVAGQQLTEYQALQAILLPSANNIAETAAVWAYGSMDNYHKAANQLAKSLGMSQSDFADVASGYSSSTVSTPHDLVLLGKAALSEPVIAEIVAQKSAQLPVSGTIYNTNKLLGEDGFNGLKTGYTSEAGYCLLFSTTRVIDGKQVTLVGSVGGQDSKVQRFDSATKLANSTYGNLRVVKVARQGQELFSYEAPWQTPVSSVTTKDLSIIAWNNEVPKVTASPLSLSGQQPSGTVAGLLTVKSSFGTKTSPLVTQQAINNPPVIWQLTH